MTAANGDRITVQRVTQTVAGEHLEWTVTVRRSSPAGVGDPLNAMTPGARQLLPDAVRAALGDWLQGRPLVADGAPLLVGRDFQVGDRRPLFPIGKTVPGAPYAGRTAPRRTLPPEAPVRLWNRDYTDKLDVIGRAVPGDGTGPGVSLRVRDKDSAAALGWLAATYQHGGAFVAWMEREWTLADWFHRSGAEVTLDLLPIPKPPRVDEVLGRVPGAGGGGPHDPAPVNIAPGDLAIDLGPARPKITVGPGTGGTAPATGPGGQPGGGAGPRIEPTLGIVDGAPYAGPWPHLQAGDRIGVEHADGTITTHEFSGDHEHPVADEPDRAGRWRAVETMGRQFAERFYREPEPAPEAYTMPDGVGLGTVPEYGKPVDTSCPEHGVDCVLPMPGGPNDRLSHGAQAASDVARSAEWLREHPTAMHPETAQTIARHGYGDLYARLDAIHDAVDTESDE